MIFDHFPATSRWRRLQIIIGDGVVRQCAIGGWHGGVRAVTEAEKKDLGDVVEPNSFCVRSEFLQPDTGPSNSGR